MQNRTAFAGKVTVVAYYTSCLEDGATCTPNAGHEVWPIHNNGGQSTQ